MAARANQWPQRSPGLKPTSPGAVRFSSTSRECARHRWRLGGAALYSRALSPRTRVASARERAPHNDLHDRTATSEPMSDDDFDDDADEELDELEDMDEDLEDEDLDLDDD